MDLRAWSWPFITPARLSVVRMEMMAMTMRISRRVKPARTRPPFGEHAPSLWTVTGGTALHGGKNGGCPGCPELPAVEGGLWRSGRGGVAGGDQLHDLAPAGGVVAPNREVAAAAREERAQRGGLRREAGERQARRLRPGRRIDPDQHRMPALTAGPVLPGLHREHRRRAAGAAGAGLGLEKARRRTVPEPLSVRR